MSEDKRLKANLTPRGIHDRIKPIFLWGLCSLFLLAVQASAQPQTINWQQYLFSGELNTIPPVLLKVDDGSFLMVCNDATYDANGTSNILEDHPTVIMFDIFGDSLWSLHFPAVRFTNLSCAIRTKDRGFLIGGSADSMVLPGIMHHGSYDGWLKKLDSTGAIEWQKLYGGSGNESIASITLSNSENGGYVLVGSTTSNDGDVSGKHPGRGDSASDMWVFEVSTSGDLIWQKCLGGSNYDVGKQIITTGDEYVICGTTASSDGDVVGDHTDSLGGSSGDAWVLKIFSGGKIDWQQCLGGSSNDEANSVLQSPNGDIIVAGNTRSRNSGMSNYHPDTLDVSGLDGDGFVADINASGNVVWQKCYGGANNDDLNSITLMADNSYLLCGDTYSFDGDVVGLHYDPVDKTSPQLMSPDLWLVKIDPVGNIKWQRCYGGTGYDLGSFATQLSDNSILIVGSTSSDDGDIVGLPSQNPYIWLFDVGDIAGVNDGPSITDLIRKNFLQIYPNPAGQVIHFQTPQDFVVTDVELYNLLGVHVPVDVTYNGNTATADSHGLPPGMYITRVSYSVSTGPGVFTLPTMVGE